MCSYGWHGSQWVKHLFIFLEGEQAQVSNLLEVLGNQTGIPMDLKKKSHRNYEKAMKI